MPNIDGAAEWQTMKNVNHPRHGTQCVLKACTTNINFAKSIKKNAMTVFWTLVQLVAKISERHEQCKKWEISLLARQISGTHSPWAQNAKLRLRVKNQ